MTLDALRSIAKALVGSLAAGIGAGATAAVDDKITTGEWWAIAAATVGALAVVYAVPNKPVNAYQGEHARPDE